MEQVTYNAGASHYDGLQLQFLRRMSRGLQAMVSYTLSRSTDNGSADVGFGSAGGYTQSYGSSVSALRLPPSAPSDFDARHVFSAAVSWEMPRLLRGWVVDGLFRGYSARPLNVLYQQILGPNGAFNRQPDIVPGQPFWIPDGNQPRGEVLNPKAFTKPAGDMGTFPPRCAVSRSARRISPCAGASGLAKGWPWTPAWNTSMSSTTRTSPRPRIFGGMPMLGRYLPLVCSIPATH